MKNIWNYFLLLIVILITNYSHGRYVDQWSTTKDSFLINEGLRISLKHINSYQDREAAISDASNIVCKIHIMNGLNIKLTFDLLQESWECLLYKPTVSVLGIRYEKCTRVEKEDLPQQLPQANNVDDEAAVDKLNQGAQKQASNNANTNEEEDDEAAVDKLNQGVQKQASNNANTNEEEDDEAAVDKLNQGVQEQPSNVVNSNEEKDDEAAVDKLNQNNVDENINREETNQNLNNNEKNFDRNNEKQDNVERFDEEVNNKNNLNSDEDMDNKNFQQNPDNQRIFKENENVDTEE
jgi:hypothetical protein